jgi:outer membrane receptor protein involved in Fe transport
MTIEFRASYGRINVQFGGNSIGNTVPSQGNIGDALARITFNSSSLLAMGPATNAPQGRIVNTYQVQDNWSWFLGRHGLKAGVNFTYQRSPNIFLPNFNGSYRFSNWARFAQDVPNRIQIAQGNPSLDFREKDTFVYFGDDFKVKNNLTVNLGLTWSYYGQPANLFHTITEKNQSGSNPLCNPALVRPAFLQHLHQHLELCSGRISANALRHVYPHRDAQSAGESHWSSRACRPCSSAGPGSV